MITGTSTGGIIALGIGLGIKASKLVSFYEDYGEDIFKKSLMAKIKNLWHSRYDSGVLSEYLQTLFGNMKVGESTVRLVIPATRKTTAEPYTYKTAHHPNYRKDCKEYAKNVALATTAAPTYFKAFEDKSTPPVVDGGLWANNPTSVGVLEGVHLLNWPPKQIKVLSLGTTQSSLRIGRKTEGLLWGTKIVKTFLRAQSFASLNISKMIVGNENILRIDSTTDEIYKLDSLEAIDIMKQLACDEEKKYTNVIEKNFLKEKALPYQPIYSFD